jgi:hypothetical protein
MNTNATPRSYIGLLFMNHLCLFDEPNQQLIGDNQLARYDN